MEGPRLSLGERVKVFKLGEVSASFFCKREKRKKVDEYLTDFQAVLFAVELDRLCVRLRCI